MAQFSMKIAGAVATVNSLFESTPQYFRAYLTEQTPDFSVSVSPSDLRFEQAELDREAVEEGFKRRQFTDPFLERAAIQRAFANHLLAKNTLLIHGSAVAVDGRGYLFTAKSGTGKSTHTRLWREVFADRAVMINDDKPFLHICPQGVTIFGSPWSGKHGLDSNLAVPLAGICLLERGPENRIAPLSPEDALPMLRKQSHEPTEALLTALTEQVPLWRMECTKDPQAARIAFASMSAQA